MVNSDEEKREANRNLRYAIKTSSEPKDCLLPASTVGATAHDLRGSQESVSIRPAYWRFE